MTTIKGLILGLTTACVFAGGGCTDADLPDGSGDGDVDGDSDADSDSDSDADTDTDADGDTDTDADGDTDTDADGDADADSDADTDTDADGDTDTDADADADSDADGDADDDCPETCVATGQCRELNGSYLPGYTCPDATPICCEVGTVDGDTDADADSDADADTDTDTDADADSDTDSDADADHKFVGNITTRGSVRSDFMNYWDQITPENEGKWGSVERSRDSYSWNGVQACYDLAQQNNIPFKQHTFVWGSQYPTWMDSLGASDQAAEIEEWISDFCDRFPNTELIDVVNESTPGHAPAGYAQSAFGNDWITRVFEIAHQYCPNSILILNDYNVLSWNTNEFISMARPAVNNGVVDAIGCQAHGLEDRSVNELQGKLGQIAEFGLPIYISEYDVAREDDNTQLRIFQQQFPMFYEHPSVAGVTIWGYVVGATWVNGSGLIQDNGNFRPAMTWLMDYLDR